VMEHPDYYKLREHLIEFLEVHAHRKKPAAAPVAPHPRPPATRPVVEPAEPALRE
jgi:hypothetical protein